MKAIALASTQPTLHSKPIDLPPPANPNFFPVWLWKESAMVSLEMMMPTEIARKSFKLEVMEKRVPGDKFGAFLL